ncbi:hypothetical protein SO802_026486 [Lithocarpus litseifolius]|uniref:Myb/SANT-like domain-containing protein n=1 Tax=Lithocarpus litseifolius TaxID=425828 RepID=A0AAW2BZS8_9ROSI
MEHGIFKAPIWLSITNALNEQTGKSFRPKQVIQKHNGLKQKQRKWSQLLSHIGLGWDKTTQTVITSEEVWANVSASGCPSYDKLRQLFASNAATSAYQISSNKPAPNSDEESALEEEIANEARHTQLDDPLATEQTQRANKSPIEEPTGKGKKVAKKADRASDITIALQEYTALTKEQFNKRTGKSMGSSDHVAQFTSGGDPCSLGRALKVLNQYNDLDDDTYINIFEGRMVFPNDPFWTFDFDDAYFHSNNDDMNNSGCGDDMEVSDCDDDMDIGFNTDSDYDSEEGEFWFVFPLVGEMVAYF